MTPAKQVLLRLSPRRAGVAGSVDSGCVSASAGEPTDPASSHLDDASTTWVRGLTCGGAEREATIDRLHELLVRIARSEANRRSGLNGIAGQELDDLADQAASDALVSILRRVEDFRGDSKFTTWCYKFVIYEVANKFGRHAWRRTGVQFDEEAWEQLPANLGAGPEEIAQSRELIAAVHQAVDDVLTPHQRRVFVAIIVNNTPLDVLVVELDSNRNAIYKTLFDARRKLHRHLTVQGYIGHGEGSHG